MKIATFNIGGLDARLRHFVPWLAKSAPDVVCLQELQWEQADFPLKDIEALGYSLRCIDQGMQSGVGILTRDTTYHVIRTSLPEGDGKDEPRYLEIAIGGVLIASIFLPSRPIEPMDDPFFKYRAPDAGVLWLKRLSVHAARVLKSKVPAVLACSFNPAPVDEDWTETLMANPQCQAAFAGLLNQGWVDAARSVGPSPPLSTYWAGDEKGQRQKGFRLDHLLASPSLAAQLTGAGVDEWVLGQDGAEKHAPCWVALEV